MGCGHFNHFNVVCQCLKVAESFVNSLDELRRKTCLHVLKFTFKLFQTITSFRCNCEPFLTALFRLFIRLGHFFHFFAHLGQIGKKDLDIVCQKCGHFCEDLSLQGLCYNADSLLQFCDLLPERQSRGDSIGCLVYNRFTLCG